jgi:hypothetical protein
MSAEKANDANGFQSLPVRSEQQEQSRFMTYAVDLPDAATVVDALTHIGTNRTQVWRFGRRVNVGLVGTSASVKGVLGAARNR